MTSITLGFSTARSRSLGAVIGVALALIGGDARSEDWIYSVRPGDNLWNLSKRYLNNVSYVQSLRAYNNIEEPDRLRPGQEIRIPMRWLKTAPVSAYVVAVQGAARRLGPGATAAGQPLRVGMRLQPGDRVQTELGASVTIEFADGSRLLLQSGAEIDLDTLGAYGETGMVDTRLELRRGRVDSHTRPSQGPGSRFEITTPSAVAAARGTDFRVEATPDGDRARSEVLEGEVQVAAAGTARSVPAGFGVVVEAGSAPPAPVELLPAPNLSSLAAVAERTGLGFEWPAVTGARAYRAQLFEGHRTDQLLLDHVGPDPSVAWVAPPDGPYLLRVRAIDASGLEGYNSRHPFTLNARPEPPLLLGPGIDSARPEGSAVEFWWAVPVGAARFRLQVARDGGFVDLVDDTETEADRIAFSRTLAPGTYHWRVATRNADGEKGPFGDPRRFRIQVVPAAPDALAPEVGEESLALAWGEARDAGGYEYQLARDEEFEELVESGTTDGTSVTLDKPGSGTFYFRSRAVSAEGVAGAYTRPQSIDIPYRPPYWLLFLLPLLVLL